MSPTQSDPIFRYMKMEKVFLDVSEDIDDNGAPSCRFRVDETQDATANDETKEEKEETRSSEKEESEIKAEDDNGVERKEEKEDRIQEKNSELEKKKCSNRKDAEQPNSLTTADKAEENRGTDKQKRGKGKRKKGANEQKKGTDKRGGGEQKRGANEKVEEPLTYETHVKNENHISNSEDFENAKEEIEKTAEHGEEKNENKALHSISTSSASQRFNITEEEKTMSLVQELQISGREEEKSTETDDAVEKSNSRTDHGTTLESSNYDQFSEPEPNAAAADQNFSLPNEAPDVAATEITATSKHGRPLSKLSNHILMMVAIVTIFGPIQGASGILTFPPSNVVAQSGTVVRLRCSTDLDVPVYWHRHLSGASDRETIYYGKYGFSAHVNGGFNIDHSRGNGSYDVIISDVKPKDAGRYICVDDGGLGDKMEMELVVVERLECEMRTPPGGFMGQNVFEIPEDEIRASCSLSYYGNQMPRFHWRWDNNTKINSIEVVSGSTGVSSKVTARSGKELNGARLTATVSDGTTSQDVAIQWTSDEVKVLYASLQLGKVEQCHGSAVVLICNPECECREERANNDQCQCVATYRARESERRFTFNAYTCDGPFSSFNVIIAVVAVVVVLTALVIALVIVKIIRSRKVANEKEKTQGTKEPLNGIGDHSNDFSTQNIESASSGSEKSSNQLLHSSDACNV